MEFLSYEIVMFIKLSNESFYKLYIMNLKL